MEWFGPKVTKLCSGQGNPDADDDDTADDDATADESNPYMSPFQAKQNGDILVRLYPKDLNT